MPLDLSTQDRAALGEAVRAGMNGELNDPNPAQAFAVLSPAGLRACLAAPADLVLRAAFNAWCETPDRLTRAFRVMAARTLYYGRGASIRARIIEAQNQLRKKQMVTA